MSRKVRIATMSLNGAQQGTVDGNRAMVMRVLDQMCAERPDIVCLPEAFTTLGMRDTLIKDGLLRYAEDVPGPTTDEVAKRACTHRTYVVCPILRRDGDRVYNSAVILDRQGQVVGVYDKMHPVTTVHRRTARFDCGVVPGSITPSFNLDFGKVGIQICFDAGFSDGWQALADDGVELVFWPSAYNGRFHLRALAFMHQYYIVSAARSSRAYFINPLGQILDHTGWLSWTARTVDLDYRVCYFDWNLQRLEELKKKYGSGVDVRVLDEEGLFMIESNHADATLAKMLCEFPMESYRDYHRRHLAPLAEVRSGRRDPLHVPETRDVP